MARRSLRRPGTSVSRCSSKRALSPKSTPTRQAKRAKAQGSSKATPAKSKYFEHPSDSEEKGQEQPDTSSAEEHSDHEDEDPAAAESPYESDACPSGEDEKPKKRGRPKKSGSSSIKPAASKGKELWRAGAELDIEPGTQLIIKKPKAREAGKTPYTDDTIHPNTLLFLRDLAENNDREWLKMHDPDYRTSLKDFNSFVERLTEKVIEADETIPELPIKDVVFRIYRDIRFSSDPTPYKTYFSAAWSRTGRKGPYAAYYVQVQPGGSYVGGGLWMPAAPSLQRLRRNIDTRPHEIKRVLTDAGIREEFFDGIEDDEKEAVRAFVKQNAESALKTRPQGYDKEHRDVELLRLRSFSIGRRVSDGVVEGPGGLARIAGLLARLGPFITYLNGVVMPD
ncbi:uncharacterized protein K452DRAFT_293012 [Aplosporella prunicola CBS 121167]|uniref:DUF2461 domain-containing protein n=1 Tax=Aplosporella prunicola CBS 121167 TaxID=1176127 RepID=A0A6A6AX48_9PEZI|nr:uncharacterized protein K452DRAFT_293136 [Aplosporella prunicola CBS 121167]XP_033391413.1 uncharacterized protein K452DRAFT_293012 [Aplosporella prunicola CBS 121167]KAF2135555.1 hypothetical protein K452DRAFT_293136 [Aplosporella prunicola CBS 121167]KAF2135695.1 hypothetical protein K452DRAFT_293012 [Aplosporella prunicola CBS 121167]